MDIRWFFSCRIPTFEPVQISMNMKKLFTAVLVFWVFASVAQENLPYQRPPKELADLIEAPTTPAVTISPDHTWMFLLERSDYPSIEELSRPELRLAGIRINPDNFGPSRANYYIGLKAKKLSEGKEYEITDLPSPLLISNVSFSPDGKSVAFLQNGANKIELWVIDLSTLAARRLSNRAVSSVFRGSFDWLSDSKHILFTAVPESRKPLPEKSRVPVGPVIEENLGKKAPNRTYQDLLNNAHDEALFDYYATSELVQVDLDGAEQVIAPAAIYASVSPSPDGKYILTKVIHRPYSYIVPAGRFPHRVQVIDRSGKLVKEIIDIPLIDNIPTGFSATQKGPRGHAWRSDKEATLYWVEAQDGGDPRANAEIRDKVFELDAPFTGTPTELISLPLRYAGVLWGDNGMAWFYEYWWNDRRQRVYQVDVATKQRRSLSIAPQKTSTIIPGVLSPRPTGLAGIRCSLPKTIISSSPETVRRRKAICPFLIK